MKHTYRYSQNGLYHAVESKPIKPVRYEKPLIIRMLDTTLFVGLILLLAYIVSYVSGLGFHIWINWIIGLFS